MIDQVIISDKKKFIIFDDMKRNFPMERPHYHNCYELYYLVSGSCKFSVENRITNINKDEILLIPPKSIHMAVDYPQMTRRFIIHFSDDCINSEFKKALSTFTVDNLHTPNNSEHVQQLIQNIRSELRSTEPLSQQAAASYLKLLLTYLIRNKSSAKRAANKSFSITLVEKMMKYVSQHSCSDISINDLCKEFGYSESYISRLFKNVSGIGFKEYVILQRLKNSEILLNTTNQSIQEIAISCGFNDSNYFSTVFKEKYGSSPMKYRRKKL